MTDPEPSWPLWVDLPLRRTHADGRPRTPPRGRQILIVFGPPGSGKGSHCPRVSALLGIPHLSTGDMLRAAVAAGTETGLKAKEAMQTGALVTDDLVVAVVVDRLAEPDCENGCVLDGFPRTTAQATALDDALARVNGQKVTKVIALECPDAALAKRVCGRWVHAESGRSYHVDFKKPKSLPLDGAVATPETMRDDETGEALTKRADDTEEALATRLSAYHAQSAPVLAHYHTTGCVARVDGNQTQERVWEAIEDALAA